MSSSKFVAVDGYDWLPRAGDLWAEYETCAAYTGRKNTASFSNFVWRHNIKTIQHSRQKLASKTDIDRATGALAA